MSRDNTLVETIYWDLTKPKPRWGHETPDRVSPAVLRLTHNPTTEAKELRVESPDGERRVTFLGARGRVTLIGSACQEHSSLSVPLPDARIADVAGELVTRESRYQATASTEPAAVEIQVPDMWSVLRFPSET